MVSIRQILNFKEWNEYLVVQSHGIHHNCRYWHSFNTKPENFYQWIHDFMSSDTRYQRIIQIQWIIISRYLLHLIINWFYFKLLPIFIRLWNSSGGEPPKSLLNNQWSNTNTTDNFDRIAGDTKPVNTRICQPFGQFYHFKRKLIANRN